MSPFARNLLQGSLIALGVAAVLAAATAWFLHTHERSEREVPRPPRGEAAWNRLYALRETLRADGLQAQTRQRVQPERFAAAPGDTVLLDIDPSLLRAGDIDALLEWVERGGHLLLRMPPPSRADADERLPPPILRQLGVEDLGPSDCVHLQVAGEEPHVELCRGQRLWLQDDVEPLLAWGDADDGHAFVRLRHGKGTVDLLADFDFLDNAALDEATHQALARQLLAPNYGRGQVHLVHATYADSWWWRALREGWPLWLPLALLLAGVLWRRGQRFGPWLSSPAAGRRSLREHVHASGALLFRHRQAPLLYGAVRDAFLARLRRRDPATAALSGEARVHALAERLQLPHSHVREALAGAGVEDRHTYFARVRTLIRMRNRL